MTRRVLVVGGGPAGLAAAEAVLDRARGPVSVTLHTLGHHLGGKANSWEHDGRVVEHGQHVLLGFYDEMRGLLQRSGVDLDVATRSFEGELRIWEDRDQRDHQMTLSASPIQSGLRGLAYTGWSLEDKARMVAFLGRIMPRVAMGVPERWDDICFTAWALERGLPTRVAASNMFRVSREAQLNWPGEISAYAMLKTLRIAGRDYSSCECHLPAGGMSALFWEPVAKRIEALGGEIKRYSPLLKLKHDGRRLTGLEFGRPQRHAPGVRYDRGPAPIVPGSEWEEADFDAVIVAVPPPALADAMDDAAKVLPGLSGVAKLTTVAPLGMQVWHKAPVKGKGIVMGLAPPLGFFVDNKPHYPRYRDDPRYGCVLHFVGQEAGYEDMADAELLSRALASARKVRGYEGLSDDGVVHYEVVRNRAPHKRYWNAEPGSLRHKPHCQTPLSGLFLAGDWIRTELDFPCMENAIRSGVQAADAVWDWMDANVALASK